MEEGMPCARIPPLIPADSVTLRREGFSLNDDTQAECTNNGQGLESVHTVLWQRQQSSNDSNVCTFTRMHSHPQSRMYCSSYKSPLADESSNILTNGSSASGCEASRIRAMSGDSVLSLSEDESGNETQVQMHNTNMERPSSDILHQEEPVLLAARPKEKYRKENMQRHPQTYLPREAMVNGKAHHRNSKEAPSNNDFAASKRSTTLLAQNGSLYGKDHYASKHLMQPNGCVMSHDFQSTLTKPCANEQHKNSKLPLELGATFNRDSRSQLPGFCLNCNSAKLTSRKCKVLHSWQYKLKKKLLMSSLHECCQSCNNSDICKSCVETIESETDRFAEESSLHLDSENVAFSVRSQSTVDQVGSYGYTDTPNHQSFEEISLQAFEDTLEDAGDFIEADFPAVTSRLMSSSTGSTESVPSSPSSTTSGTGDLCVGKTHLNCERTCNGEVFPLLIKDYDGQSRKTSRWNRPKFGLLNNDDPAAKVTSSIIPLLADNAHTNSFTVGECNNERDSTAVQGMDSFLFSPEIDFDFDVANLSASSNGQIELPAATNSIAGAFGYNFCEIPYADETEPVCLSPDEGVSLKPQFGCTTNDLSASSCSQNQCSTEEILHSVMQAGSSNFQNHIGNLQEKCFSKLTLDDRDDISFDSEDSSSHDSNDGVENEEGGPKTLLTAEDCPSLEHFLQNQAGLQLFFLASDEETEERTTAPSEPIYEDIDDVQIIESNHQEETSEKREVGLNFQQHEQKKKGKHFQGKQRRTSIERIMIWNEYQAYILQVKQLETEVSACGPVAILNVLKAFDISIGKSEVIEKSPINLRDQGAPLPQYLFSRSSAGTTASMLIDVIELITKGAIRGRFFDFYPERNVQLLKWLSYWAKKGVYLTNPLELVPENILMQRLASDSVLLVRRQDVISRFGSDTDLSDLMHHSDEQWRSMNVLGQVVNVLREADMPRVPGYRPQLTSHIQIPAAYRAGITLFLRSNSEFFKELMDLSEFSVKEAVA